jgi:hypothetical protein
MELYLSELSIVLEILKANNAYDFLYYVKRVRSLVHI